MSDDWASVRRGDPVAMQVFDQQLPSQDAELSAALFFGAEEIVREPESLARAELHEFRTTLVYVGMDVRAARLMASIGEVPDDVVRAVRNACGAPHAEVMPVVEVVALRGGSERTYVRFAVDHRSTK